MAQITDVIQSLPELRPETKKPEAWPWYHVHCFPVLCRIGKFYFVSYGLGVSVGAFFATMIVMRRLEVLGYDWRRVYAYFLWFGMPTAWVSSRVFAIVADYRKFLLDPIGELRATTLYAHGAIIGGAIVGLIVSHIVDIPVLVLLDVLAVSAVTIEAFSRIGCFAYGCCYGRPTTVPWGVKYRNPESKVVRLNGEQVCPQRLHPAPIYTSACMFAALAAYCCFASHQSWHGQIVAIYLIWHSVTRIVIERFRGDERGKIGQFTLTGLVATIMLASGIFLLLAGPSIGSGVEQAYAPIVEIPALGLIVRGLTVTVFAFLVTGVHYRKLGSLG